MSNKSQLKAAGEAYVTYLLSKSGWYVVNANAGVNNMPNFDLIAMKDNDLIKIQVKTTRDKGETPVGNVKNAKIISVNDKVGPQADVLALVNINKNKDEVDYLNIKEAKKVIVLYGNYWIEEKKKKNAKLDFPINIPYWGTYTNKQKSEFQQKFLNCKINI